MIELLKEMFAEMVEKKDASLIPTYYHPEFICYANDKVIHYDKFLESHTEIYATDIQYHVEYDDETWVVENHKLAGRIFITIEKTDIPKTKLEVILITEFKDNKIFRIWELTYPDWSQISTFENMT